MFVYKYTKNSSLNLFSFFRGFYSFWPISFLSISFWRTCLLFGRDSVYFSFDQYRLLKLSNSYDKVLLLICNLTQTVQLPYMYLWVIDPWSLVKIGFYTLSIRVFLYLDNVSNPSVRKKKTKSFSHPPYSVLLARTFPVIKKLFLSLCYSSVT